MPRTLIVGEATPEAAFLTDETGHDIAVVNRLGPSQFTSERKPLTDAEWQKVIDIINEALKGKEI